MIGRAKTEFVNSKLRLRTKLMKLTRFFVRTLVLLPSFSHRRFSQFLCAFFSRSLAILFYFFRFCLVSSRFASRSRRTAASGIVICARSPFNRSRDGAHTAFVFVSVHVCVCECMQDVASLSRWIASQRRRCNGAAIKKYSQVSYGRKWERQRIAWTLVLARRLAPTHVHDNEVVIQRNERAPATATTRRCRATVAAAA